MTVPLALALLGPATASAGDSDAFLLFEEEARVITASRREQTAFHSPSAVDVITQEDIRASGAQTLWDILRFRVGMDVVEGRAGDGNRAIVSVRGFPQEYVNNLQYLVDGRSAYNAYSGGIYWQQLPVQIQDIERIEIVRGPSAALFGSNAGLGVINIITKKPKARLAGEAQAVGGNRGLRGGSGNVEIARPRYGYRASYGYLANEGQPSVAADPANDFVNSNKADARGYWRSAGGAELEFFTGGAWERLGGPFRRSGRYDSDFQMVRMESDPGEDSSVEVTASRNAAVHRISSFFDLDYASYDAEALHRLSWADGRQQTTWGAAFRYSRVESAQVFTGKPSQSNRLWRGFAHQSWKPSDAFSLVGAASLEHSETGGLQPAYQAVAMAYPAENHLLRASYALAPTIPNIYETAVNHRPSSFARLVGNPNLRSQKIHNHELGYTGFFREERVRAEANFFYMKIQSLSASYFADPNSFPRIISFDNLNEAIARGVEARLDFRWRPGCRVYSNYTYEYITDGIRDVVVTQATPRHKVNLGAQTALGGGFSASVNAGYKDGYTTSPANRSITLSIPAYWRLDARLAYRPVEAWEIFISGQNLLLPRHKEFPNVDSIYEVPRTFAGGISVRWGS